MRYVFWVIWRASISGITRSSSCLKILVVLRCWIRYNLIIMSLVHFLIVSAIWGNWNLLTFLVISWLNFLSISRNLTIWRNFSWPRTNSNICLTGLTILRIFWWRWIWVRLLLTIFRLLCLLFKKYRFWRYSHSMIIFLLTSVSWVPWNNWVFRWRIFLKYLMIFLSWRILNFWKFVIAIWLICLIACRKWKTWRALDWSITNFKDFLENCTKWLAFKIWGFKDKVYLNFPNN